MRKMLIFLIGILSYIPVLRAQEFLLHEETFTWTKDADECGGYHYWSNLGNAPSTNWKVPYDYQLGQYYFRFEVISQPTSEPFKLNMCIWTEFNGSTWKEECMGFSPTLAGSGSVVTFNSPVTYQLNGVHIDWTNLAKLWRMGNPIYVNGHNLGPSTYCTDHPEEWVHVDSYFPMKMRITIVAVAAGYTFSGWSNYLGGTPPPPTKQPTPTYGIDYAGEQTNKVVPSTDEYSYNANMSALVNGNGAKLHLTPGQDVYFRTKAAGSLLASDIQHLVVPSRPAAPAFALNTSTNMTTTAVTSDYEYSSSADMSGAVTGTNTAVSIPAGTTKYFRKKATASAFKSNVQTLNAASVPPPPPPPVTGGLVASWPMENSGNDISGNNHHLTLFNGATYSTDKKQGSYSFSLDGVNDYAASDAVNLGNEFTIMMWAKLTSTSGIRTLIANAPSGDKLSGFKFMINTYGINDRRIIFQSGNATGLLHSTTTAVNTFGFNVWNHVAVVVNRTTGVATIYYNGINVTSGLDSHTAFNTSAVLRLGMMTDNLCGMGGFLDDVKIYGRALSQAEIQAGMSGSQPASPNAPGSLTASLAGSSAQLGWTDNATTENGFLVERSLNSLTGYSQVASLPANTTSYTDNGVSPSTTYYYRVAAYNGSGNSAYSNTAFVTTGSTPPPVTGGLIASWPLDNSGSDISGNNHNLTLFNGATYSTDKQRGTNSLSLDGVNDYASSDAINMGNEFTITMWAKLTIGYSIRTLIANTSSGDVTSGFKLFVNTYGINDRRIIFESGNGGAGLHYTTTSNNVFSFDAWNHVALVVNRTTGVATIYYNGTNVTSSVGSHTAFNTNAVLRLGQMTNNICTMGGFLDNVKVYGKALSQAEIQSEIASLKSTTTAGMDAPDETESIYPNPFLNELVLENTSAARVQILDMTGRVWMEEIHHPEDKLIHINTESLMPGIYVVKICKEDGSIQVRKVIKSNN
jgi:hypothetical protein